MRNGYLQVSQIKYVSYYHAQCVLHEELEATNPTVDNSELNLLMGWSKKIIEVVPYI